MARTLIGVDIGGTKIAGGLVVADSGSLRVRTRRQVPTPAHTGAAAVVDAVIDIVGQLVDDATALELTTASGVGIGTAGVVDEQRGIILAATDHIREWAGTPIGPLVADRTGLATRVVNDVHAHALGELHAGTGHDTPPSSMLFVAAGTGVGGSVILDGRPVLGARHAAGHLGHVSVAEAAGLPCPCGGVGQLESVSSGPGLLDLYRRMGGRPELDPPAIVAATATDPIAAAAVHVSGSALGRAIAGWIAVLDPQRVVVSGGLAEADSPWWRAMRQAVAADTLPILAECPVVAPAAGMDGPLLGAASLHLLDADEFTSTQGVR